MAALLSDNSRIGDSALAARLRGALAGEVLFDRYSRGRYATDASIYQIEPLGVVLPKSAADIEAALAVAAEEGVPVLPRGGGTSQCGQTVGPCLVVDTSKYLDRVLDLDIDGRRVAVEPGLVLDRLNARLKMHGLFFPVDISTGSRATLGGMAGNNSCGARSIRYGNMVHNVHAIDAVLASGETHRFAPVPGNLAGLGDSEYASLVQDVRALAAAEADEIAARMPKLLRRVGGYNIDMVSPAGHNMASLLVGSEGTLGFFTRLELDLEPIPPHKVLGICRFGSLHDAMAATKPIVALDPSAVELADRNLIDLARAVPLYHRTIETFIGGAPEAVLLVEFAGEDAHAQRSSLAQLSVLLADLGHPDAVAEVTDAAAQAAVWEVRKAGLNIVMSMKGDGKPISFVEDCAVALDDLPAYTERLTGIFRKHGTHGTWYAHASVGCLHVRPVLDMKAEGDVKAMRAIAEEAFEMVRAYKGSHSGEHGDGIVRSEFHEAMFGRRIVRAFEAIKLRFDPSGLFNPGKIVRPWRMDDRRLFRYRPDYAPAPFAPALDWSAWGDGGFLGAVEMCNNNGACRNLGAGVMCPSFRATGDEIHVTRGRANSLRLALTGQLGEDALASDEMAETMALCIGCKGCKRECPTGVDMARMKIEVERRRAEARGLSRRDRLFGWLPRYAPVASRLRPIMNARNRSRLLRRAGELTLGLSAKRNLPTWHWAPFVETPEPDGDGTEVVLLPDTFATWFEPEIPRAALAVLRAAGYRVSVARAQADDASGARPLCCGRTFLAVGAVEQARAEAERSLRVLMPYAERGAAIVGLEPSCLFTLRDEWTVLLPGERTAAVAGAVATFEEFLVGEHAAGRAALPLAPVEAGTAFVHGHCHQKAFGAAAAVIETLSRIPGLDVKPIESTCCGMAGAFGYQAESYDMSMRIGALDLFPALGSAPAGALVVADGTSCRQQIAEGAGRRARHAAEVLAASIAAR